MAHRIVSCVRYTFRVFFYSGGIFFFGRTRYHFSWLSRACSSENTLTLIIYAENVSTFYIINIMYDVCIKILFSLCVMDGVCVCVCICTCICVLVWYCVRRRSARDEATKHSRGTTLDGLINYELSQSIFLCWCVYGSFGSGWLVSSTSLRRWYRSAGLSLYTVLLLLKIFRLYSQGVPILLRVFLMY